MKIFLYIFLPILFFSACTNSTSNSDSTSSSSSKIAYFYDTFTNGIQYNCGTISGITGDIDGKNGSFRYTKDCNVIFSIGKVHIGSINGNDINSTKLYPTTLLGLNTINSNDKRVVNILRFLQSIDDDNDPSNGINIIPLARDNLLSNSVESIDLTDIYLSENKLENIVKTVDINNSLVSTNDAISHFESTLREYVDNNIDTVGPSKPYLTKEIHPITNQSTTEVTVEVNGEENSDIYLAFNKDGNTSNLIFKSQNIKIGSSKKANLTLKFDDDSISYFYYFIQLRDDAGHLSEYLPIKVLKDFTPPFVLSNVRDINASDNDKFFITPNVTDTLNIKYSIVDKSEDNRSIHGDLFKINPQTGKIEFKEKPDFEDTNTTTFTIVARAMDEALNMTDILFNITLINQLDNAPQLNIYSDSIIIREKNDLNSFEYNLSSTLKSIDDAPDNVYSVSYLLNDQTDNLFIINENSGILKINPTKFNNEKLNYEYYENLNIPNNFDINISISNEYNSTNFILNVTIQNEIEEIPIIINNIQNSSVSEVNNDIISISSLSTNSQELDKKTVTKYNIVSINGYNTNPPAFEINPTSGEITTSSSNLSDYYVETNNSSSTNTYTIVVNATNLWWDGSEHNSSNISFDVNITNSIDFLPKITYSLIDANLSIPEIANTTTNILQVIPNGNNADENNIEQFSIQSVVKGSTTFTSHPFIIDSTTGLLSTVNKNLNNFYTETLNNSDVDTYTITIKAQNSFGIKLATSFDVNITNVIDNLPILLSATNLTYEENSSTPTTTNIYTIQTNASNYDESNISKFSIVSGNTNNKFAVDEINGTITLNSLLDWESEKNYSLVLNATNIWWDGSEHNSSNITLDINVSNIAEIAPIIKGVKNLQIHENISKNINILTIETNNTIFTNELEDEQMINSVEIIDNDGNFTLELNEDGDLPLLYLKTSNTINLNYSKKQQYNLQLKIGNDDSSVIKDLNITIVDDINKDLPLIVLLLQYNDINLTNTLSNIQNKIFTQATDGDKNLNDYFKRVSKEKFQFSYATETFDDDTNGLIVIDINDTHPQDNPTALNNDVKEALIKAGDFIDFASFDINKTVGNSSSKDGNITNDELAILVLVAGGERTFGDTNLSIGSKVFQIDLNQTVDGVDLNGSYAVMGELINNKLMDIGLMAKMLSNSILGFKKDEDKYIIENYGLMGNGYKAYDDNNISIPVHPNAYNKIKQGWVTPELVTKDTNLKFYYANSITSYNVFRINTSNPNIYYLLEYRDYFDNNSSTLNNYDNGLNFLESSFEGGIITWKVNETTGDNKNLEIVTLPNTSSNILTEGNSNISIKDDDNTTVFEYLQNGLKNTQDHTFNIEVNIP